MTTAKKVPQRGRRLGKQAWVDAAKIALIEGGIETVKIERLAKSLKATRAGFYYHFDSHEALIKDLLKDWKTSNTQAYKEALQTDGGEGEAELQFINTMWVQEQRFDPAYDSAVRDWARVSKPVAREVRRVDNARIEILKQIYLDLGYPEQEAFVRARVAYFHQMGYIALGLNESRKQREALAPLYLKVLMGR